MTRNALLFTFLFQLFLSGEIEILFHDLPSRISTTKSYIPPCLPIELEVVSKNSFIPFFHQHESYKTCAFLDLDPKLFGSLTKSIEVSDVQVSIGTDFIWDLVSYVTGKWQTIYESSMKSSNIKKYSIRFTNKKEQCSTKKLCLIILFLSI